MGHHEVIITITTAVFASSGFWAVLQLIIQGIQKRKEAKIEAEKERETKNDPLRQLTLGLAHDRIYTLCKEYIERGNVRVSEYDNLMYIYRPYHKCGGNGTGDKLVHEVEELPLINDTKNGIL